MEKDDLRKIASSDTGGDKRKRELLEDKLEGVLVSTFGMKCLTDQPHNAVSEEEVRKFVIQTLEELRKRKKNDKK